jgi:hypothetical protein
MQPDKASDARQHNGRQMFRHTSDEASDTTLKAKGKRDELPMVIKHAESELNNWTRQPPGLCSRMVIAAAVAASFVQHLFGSAGNCTVIRLCAI